MHLCDAGLLGAEYRTLDGSGNNLRHPSWGVNGATFLRYPPYRPRYAADNSSMVAGLPNPRLISNTIDAFIRKTLNPRLLNDMHTTWGLFLSHDLTSTSSGNEPAPVPVPACDPDFDPSCTGNVTLPFTRSRYAMQDGARQQFNDASSILDAAPLYGSDPTRAAAVRSFVDGKLLINAAGEVPLISATTNVFLVNPVRRNTSLMRLVGDPRNNISPQLLALHSLFLREHNRYCDTLKAANPSWSDETLYQESRRRVIAHIQRITYTEYLPGLLGVPLPLYAGYDENVNPTMANFFSACAMRYGHPELTSVINRLTESWESTPGGPLLMRDTFFNPQLGLSEGIEPLLRGMLYSGQWRVEPEYQCDVRNHLFENPGKSRPWDLMVLNIQRGRDHGLPGHNDARAAYGLNRLRSFQEVSSRPEIVALLSQLYATVDDIDPIVGSQAEDEVQGNLGPLAAAPAIQDQFWRVRAGDRLWWENGHFDMAEQQTIRDTTLTDIINRNTNVSFGYDHAFFRQEASLDAFSAAMPYLPALGASYPNLKELDRGYRLYWDVDLQQAVVRFAVQAHGKGWVGLGLAQYDAKQPLHSYMYHVDMVVGHLAGGIPVLDDRFSFEVGQPSRDVDLGCSDDLTATSLEVYDTYRVMRFTRPLVTPDSQLAKGRLQNNPDVVKSAEVVRCDTPIVMGTDYFVIYAANPTDDALLYHGAARGAGRVTLIPAPPLPTAAGGMDLGLALGLGVGLGVVLLLAVAGAIVLLRRQGGKDNHNAPREAPLCLLFTDIEQSTMLWSLNQTVMAKMIDLHTTVIRRVIAQHHAFEVKTIGDSFMVAVKDVRSAVSIAIDIQLQLLRAPWSEPMLALVAEAFPSEDCPGPHGVRCWHGPRVRIGAHFADVGSGVIVEKDRVSGSFDYFGNPVNVAARIESLAYGGQVLVSGTLMDALPELQTDPNLLIEALGHVKVKGVPVPVEVFQVAPVELAGRTFPPLQAMSHGAAKEPTPVPAPAVVGMAVPRQGTTTTDLPGSVTSSSDAFCD